MVTWRVLQGLRSMRGVAGRGYSQPDPACDADGSSSAHPLLAAELVPRGLSAAAPPARAEG